MAAEFAALRREMAEEFTALRQEIAELGDKFSAAIARQPWRLATIIAVFAAVLTLGRLIIR